MTREEFEEIKKHKSLSQEEIGEMSDERLAAHIVRLTAYLRRITTEKEIVELELWWRKNPKEKEA